MTSKTPEATIDKDMAFKLSETMKLLDAQDKQKAEDNKFGSDLIKQAEMMTNKVNKISEDAAMHLLGSQVKKEEMQMQKVTQGAQPAATNIVASSAIPTQAPATAPVAVAATPQLPQAPQAIKENAQSNIAVN